MQQRSKGLLPDTGSPYEGEGGNVHDAIDFLLSNFIEMNKLWVRMQHQVRRSVKGCGNVWDGVGCGTACISEGAFTGSCGCSCNNRQGRVWEGLDASLLHARSQL